MNKNSYSYRSSADARQKNNPYTPFASYLEYCNWIVVQAVELNNIVMTLNSNTIAEVWIHNIRFRQVFRRMAYMAHYVHREEMLQRLLPWCNVDIAAYCTRFDHIEKEKLVDYFVK